MGSNREHNSNIVGASFGRGEARAYQRRTLNVSLGEKKKQYSESLARLRGCPDCRCHDSEAIGRLSSDRIFWFL